MNDPKEPRSGVSRRAFLQGSGAAAAAVSTATIPEPRSARAADATAKIGPGKSAVTLAVNGKSLETEIEPRVTLLDALRDYLDVTGCKRVCDRGTCGACTVLLDGKPVYACSVLAIDVAGKKITTAEGLAAGDALNRVQQLFVKHDASQCGFCTPGFVVACSAAIESNPRASAAQIKVALDGNICRCGTYAEMSSAIAELTGGTV